MVRGLVYYLALEGWCSTMRTFPQPTASAPPLPIPALPTLDVRALAEAWRDRVTRAGHWRDPELTLAKLAQLMDMSAAQISRLTNEGLGQNFNEAINRMRVAAVQERLRDASDERDILTLAFDAGFSSKPSFNRSFKAYCDRTPSQYRKDALEAAI